MVLICDVEDVVKISVVVLGVVVVVSCVDVVI